MLDPKTFIFDYVCKALDQDPDPETFLAMPLDSMGLDSLELMEMLNDIEDAFQIRFDDQAIGDGKTVQDLISYVAAEIDSKN
jgi:acyl carrier protein